MYSKQPMSGGKPSSEIEAARLNTFSSAKAQLLQNLREDRDYRRSFVAERIYARLPLKIRAMRGERTQGEIAQLAGKAQTWISKLEDPNYGKFTLKTLLEVASIYDVGLDVDFVPFSHLLDEITNVSPETFTVPCFWEEDASGAFEIQIGSAPPPSPPRDQAARQTHPTALGRVEKVVTVPQLTAGRSQPFSSPMVKIGPTSVRAGGM